MALESGLAFCYTQPMPTIQISEQTARRYVLGKQGLWPGRRWRGQAGLGTALGAIEALQLDPLNPAGRSQDIALWGRVLEYEIDDWRVPLYQERQFFDYGGGLFVYPMEELPYWRLHMQRRTQEKRWADFAAAHPQAIADVRAALRQNGPLGNRHLSGSGRVNSYRGGKDTSLAFFYLWLTGELMVHHREGFERVYDFLENIAPAQLQHQAPLAEAEDHLARKVVAFLGLMRERRWGSGVGADLLRKVDKEEAASWVERLIAEGVFARVHIAGSPESWLVVAEDVPHLELIEGGSYPAEWQPLGASLREEAVFLAPLEIVSTRGRAKSLFGFDLLWEVYKPAKKRRWGYYTLPVLYGDQLVARLDPKLDRSRAALQIKGFWLDDESMLMEGSFGAALGAGLCSFARYLGVESVDMSAVEPIALRRWLEKLVQR